MGGVKALPMLITTMALCLAPALVRAADTRADFLKLIEQKPVDLAFREESSSVTNGRAISHFSYAADARQRVPGLLVKSTNSTGRCPVVIALHGTGGNKQGMLPMLRRLADKGFVAVAI